MPDAKGAIGTGAYPALAANPKELQEHCKALADAQAKVDTLYARWQELEEKQR